MNLTLHYYDIFPKVFLINRETEITIRPLGQHVAFSGEYQLRILSAAQGRPGCYPCHENYVDMQVQTRQDGCIQFSHCFAQEGQYLIQIQKDGNWVVELPLYALSEDMEGRYPYRGDLHIHTSRSDGQQAPAIVAANYRRNGYDFMAITDHERYYPSLEAKDAYQDVPIGLNIVEGEEVHLPDNDVHIVNFGGQYSVNGLWESSWQSKQSTRRSLMDNPPEVLTKEQYRQQVMDLIPTLHIPEHIEPFAYASCIWILEHIRKGDGLGIFCHPYWKIGGPYQVPEVFTEYMTQTHPFDAFEVLGGELYYEQNGFQTIRYYEDKAKGIHYPIVGSTDSHNSLPDHSGMALMASTFVFAKENSRKALIHAIKDEYSVAVDTISKEYRLVGDFRLVKYARFLLDEITPLHDELCFEEGRLMKAYATGDPDAADGLKFIAGRMDKFYQKYFYL